MKKLIFSLLIVSIVMTACSTVQSIMRSTFPYTASLLIPENSAVNKKLSTSAVASTLDQIIIGQGKSGDAIKDVRIASVKIEATAPTTQNLGVFKSIKVFISRGDSAKEVMVASREDIGGTIGRSMMLDIENTEMLDSYLQGSSVRVRLEYVLRSVLHSEVTLKSSLAFNVSPNTTPK